MDKFSQLQQKIHDLNTRIGGEWKSHSQLLWIMEELGEVSRELRKLENLPAKLHSDSKITIQTNLKEEIGDVIYGLISFCKSMNIDFLDALNFSLSKFQDRHS